MADAITELKIAKKNDKDLKFISCLLCRSLSQGLEGTKIWLHLSLELAVPPFQEVLTNLQSMEGERGEWG